MSGYDPATVRLESFVRARRGFSNGGDSPRALLERCLARIDVVEPAVRAFVSYDVAAARAAADGATGRWLDGRALSPVDGLPFGVKDCFDVAGLPTRVNSAVFEDSPPATVDAAHVDALRHGGAHVLGKTTTTEWTMALPPHTWNPWDVTRTPGGSSAGSAAAVAAGMLPLATGSQVRGSVIRPASICGVPAYKPTFGALNRHGGIDPSPSLNHLGLIGASIADIWDAAQRIAGDVGGDPGHRGLALSDLPRPQRPLRLARQYTAGWDKTDSASQERFERWLAELSRDGVAIIEPSASPDLAAYEAATASVIDWFFDLFREVRWPLRALREANPIAFSHVMHRHIDRAAALPVAVYHGALEAQQALRRLHRALEGVVDGFVTLAHIGPGQFGQPESGTPWYNDASSAVGAPTMNLPLLSVDGLPLGVQLMGFEHHDARMIGFGRWLTDRLRGHEGE